MCSWASTHIDLPVGKEAARGGRNAYIKEAMAALGGSRTAALAVAAAACLVAGPAFARGGHGGGGGGHGGGARGGGGHVGGYGGGHYAAPHVAPHYGAPSGAYHGPIGGVHTAPMHRPGYVGGGHGAYVVGGRVPAFYGGPHGRVWWGPHYGWRVPVYWGGYYRPYGAYWGVGFWVTDWVMLDYLAAEEARIIAYRGPGAVAVPIESPPVDGGVREELRAQIAEILASPAPPPGTADATTGNTLVVNDPRVARALAAPHHVFVVSGAVSVANRSQGGACNLTGADLVRTSAPIPSGQATADVAVVGAKNGSCALGSTVSLPVADLVRFEEGLLTRVARGAAAAEAPDTGAGPADAPPSPNAPPAAPPPAPNAPAPGAPAPSAPGGASSPTAPPPVPGSMAI
jgi:hypothetical protein